MPYAQTSTSLGALSSVTSGAWVAIPRGASQVTQGGGAGPIVTIANTAVTSGGVVAVEGRYRSGVIMDNGGASSAKELQRYTVAANGTLVLPLKDLVENGIMPDEIRLTCVSRTDGTFTGAVLTAA